MWLFFIDDMLHMARNDNDGTRRKAAQRSWRRKRGEVLLFRWAAWMEQGYF